MKLPRMKEIPTTREFIDVFGGYNHNLRIGHGEFFDMKNLTSSSYPVLSPRPKRGFYTATLNGQGLIAKDALCYVDNGDFIINGYHIPMGLSNEPKQLISMGSYVIIMPDKKWVNTTAKDGVNAYEHGNIDISVTVSSAIWFEPCSVEYASEDIYSDEPHEGSDGDLWLDTSIVPNVLKRYSATTGEWVEIPTNHIKINGTGIGSQFSVNDGVTISGIKDNRIANLNSASVIYAKGDDYIVVKGVLDEAIEQNDPITVERRMPNMDFVIESGNRLWGCKYGVALNGQVVNEIYASKLGDFKNWNCFEGISTDSYVASVGTDGQFTGAIAHLGYPLFFKENCVHKVYGYYPANYQIQTTACRGVQSGCSKSLAIVNEVLYYKSRYSVCAYDGSLPVEVSYPLGEEHYTDAVAGAIRDKYYLSMVGSDNKSNLFVYDTTLKMWHKEDNVKARCFCTHRDDLYYIDDRDNAIRSVLGSGEDENKEGSFEWMAETGVIGVDSPDKKYVSRIDVRMSLELGTRVYFYIMYDHDNDWKHLFTMDGVSLRSFAVPIRPERCDHMRLKIVGYGDAKIYSICKTIEQGSDV